MISPCDRHCSGRSVTCHIDCEKYQSFVARQETIRNNRLKRRIIDQYIMDAVRNVKNYAGLVNSEL